MPRRSDALLLFDALAIEGGLLPAEWLAKVAALDAPAQKPADYGVPKGLELRDEITRYWRSAEALRAEFATACAASEDDAAAATRAFVRQLLTQVFGFTDLSDAGRREAGGRTFEIALEALGGRVPVIAGVPDEALDAPVSRYGDGRRRSAWDALQEYLNASGDALWGIACNGLRLRLGRDNVSLTRPAWIEADLERIFEEERFADFSVLWLVLHASRFGRPGAPVTECPLEAWRDAARDAGTRARDQLRDGVEAALLALGRGFLANPDNVDLRQALATGDLSPGDYFNELLRLVYRMIFLLTVEEREILHGEDVAPEARALYAEGYGMRRLRERALRRSQYDRHGDLWASLRPVFAALGRPGGEPVLGLPELGGLFALDQCPHLDGCALENRALLDAVFRLAWLREPAGLARVNWKDMGPEELGSIYESLLELVPQVGDGGRAFDFAGAAGNARKLTGSYYTPDALVQQLLDTALDPVVDERLATHPDDPARALLGISVIDPACGSGHFLLAAARRLAMRLARVRAGGTPGAKEYRNALRDVATHCIHGVDRNPMALELARMSLWLETYTPDRALGFLDHHLVLGDSLVGLLDPAVLGDGIPDDAFKALTGDDRDAATTLRRVNRNARKVLEKLRKSENLSFELGTDDLEEAFARLDELADDAIENVQAKRARYEELRAEAENNPVALAADLYVGAFLMPKRLVPGEAELTDRAAVDRFPQTGTLLMALDGTMRPEHSVLKAARKACREANVLHWPLAFPQVFAKGGFDVVLGNPPWERIKLQEQEFFAVRGPEIAQARNKAARDRAIEALARKPEGSPQRTLYEEFVDAKRQAEAVSGFCHSEARYPLTGVGDVNTYALFAETAYRLTSDHGRAGLVLPTGIATDDSTKKFFGEVVESRRLGSLYDFENREGLFPGVHRSYKFCLLNLGRADAAEFAFFLTRAHELADERRRFTLTAEDFRLINPNTRTCPVFRSRRDAELTKKIYGNVPVLIDETKSNGEGNPWGLSFKTMFHMSNDSGQFLDEPAPDALPLYEAKMIHQFDHRWATYAPPGEVGDAPAARDATDEEKADPSFTVRPRYWVPAREVRRRAARVPKGVLDILESGEADWCEYVVVQWLAGHFRNRGNEERANEWLARSLAVERPPAEWVGWSSPEAFEREYPLTEDEVACARRDDRASERLTAVVDAKTPRWFLGWRDICRATDERTVIASMMPWAGVGNKIPLMLFGSSASAEHAACLLACLDSLVHDYAARQKIGGTTLNYFIFKQLPVLPPIAYSQSDLAFIVPRVLELTYTAEDLRPWAEDLGYTGDPFPWDPDRRAVLRAELDAYYARLYGLTRDELRYILDPADVLGADYPTETFRVLKQNEERRYGEYRTRRLVLEIYDRLAEAARTGVPYRTRLEPPPGEPRTSHRAPPEVGGPRRDVIPFQRVRPRLEERYETCLPLLTLQAAAGAFGPEQRVEFEDWVEVQANRTFRKGMFVAQVVGHSMEPQIPDGTWCIFDSLRGVPPRNGETVLAELHDTADPEHGGRYTVKRFHWSRSSRSNGDWESVVRLEPENPEFPPIVLRHAEEDEPSLRLVARLVEILAAGGHEG